MDKVTGFRHEDYGFNSFYRRSISLRRFPLADATFPYLMYYVISLFNEVKQKIKDNFPRAVWIWNNVYGVWSPVAIRVVVFSWTISSIVLPPNLFEVSFMNWQKFTHGISRGALIFWCISRWILFQYTNIEKVLEETIRKTYPNCIYVDPNNSGGCYVNEWTNTPKQLILSS